MGKRNKTQATVLSVLGISAGAVATFFGVRAVQRWMEQRAHDQQYQDNMRRRMGFEASERSMVSGRYQPVDQPDRGVPTIEGLKAGEKIEAELYVTPDPIPATGATMAPEMTRSRSEGSISELVRGLSTPLAGALIGYHEMIERLRERRRSGSYAGPTGLSLTPDDRSRFGEVVDRLDSQMAGYDPGSVEGDALAEKAYRLITKVREAMQNLEYNDNDLFRIHGEVQTEICQMLPDLPEDELAQVREAYT